MKKLIFLIFAVQASFVALAQSRVADLFVSMPDSVMSLLTERNRKDMVDFYNNNIQARLRNRLNEYVELDTLTDEYLHLTLSEASDAEIRLLPTADSLPPLVCLIRTVSARSRDSRVEFYDTCWHRLPWLQLPRPAVSDFFAVIPDSVAQMAGFAIRAVSDLPLVEIKTTQGEPIFTLSLSLAELPEEERKAVLPLMHPVRYRWTGRDFKQL